METIKIASFDIGIKNFAMYVEEAPVYRGPVINSYNPDGSFDDESASRMEKSVYPQGRSQLLKVFDISEGLPARATFDDTLRNLSHILDTYNGVLNECRTILIEKQVTNNKKAMLIAQHLWTYLSVKFPDAKIVRFAAQRRNELMGCPRLPVLRAGSTNVATHTVADSTNDSSAPTADAIKYVPMSYRDRKKWSVTTAMKIFECRRDEISLNLMKKSKKKDDLADTVLQLVAYKTECQLKDGYRIIMY